MSANANAKLKLLYLMRMLQEETDPDHGLTMAQIIAKLDKLGISAERKSIYRDLDLLREFGMEINTYQRNPVEYALASREFSLGQLMTIVDAVNSSRFLTQRQSDDIVRKVKLLASQNERALLARRIHVEGRAKGRNESVYAIIDAIHRAMAAHRCVEFSYWKTGIDGKSHPRHEGARQVVTPVRVSYGEGCYYLTSWNEAANDWREYRIDRMRDVSVSPLRAARRSNLPQRETDAAKEDAACFGHFFGPRVCPTLKVHPDKVDIVVERFGPYAQFQAGDDGYAHATVTVYKSEQFFGWIAGLGGMVTIEKPFALVMEYKSYLQKLIDS